MNKKKIYIKNRIRLFDKVVVLSVALAIVFGAFLPAVNSQNELDMDGHSVEESEKSEIYPDESVADEINISEPVGSKIHASDTGGGSLRDRFLAYFVGRLTGVFGDYPIISRLHKLFIERNVHFDTNKIDADADTISKTDNIDLNLVYNDHLNNEKQREIVAQNLIQSRDNPRPLDRDSLLVDSEFNDSTDSADLRANSTSQDWYESRNQNQNLLTLDTAKISSNNGKKAAIKGYDLVDYVYLTQELGSAQTGLFNISFDIYIDKISDRDAYDRTCHLYMGDDHLGTSGPCSTGRNGSYFLTFYDSTPGDTGDDIELRARESASQTWGTTSGWTQLTTGLSYDTWITIRLDVNVSGGTYDVFVDDVLIGDDVLYYDEYESSSVKHISFYGGGAARGDFYLDNVFTPVTDRHKLDISVVGSGSVSTDPGESTYANGTIVELEAVADLGWSFTGWSGDLGGSTNPDNVTMDSDKTIVAQFTMDEYILTIDIEGNGTVSKDPSQATYHYGDIVELNATADPGWSFNYWSGDLSGSKTPDNITITGNKTVTANFTKSGYNLTIYYEGNGTVSRDPDQTTYSYNEVVELEAFPDIGWSFNNWSGDLISTVNPDNITMDDTKIVTVNFTQNEYTLSINIEGNGTVSKYPDQSTYNYGDFILLNATGNASWMFNHWNGDLSGFTNPNSITITDNMTVTANFTSVVLLVDNEFIDSDNSSDLRENNSIQDWYESRHNDSTVLTLDTSDVAGNTGKKAALKGFEVPGYAYLTQEFSSLQHSTFNFSFDIYIDRIEDYGDYDRVGYIYIGDNSKNYTSGDVGKGPCSTSEERFVLLTFYDNGGTGSSLGIRAREFRHDNFMTPQPWSDTSTWTEIDTGLEYDDWHTIKLAVNVNNGTYDVYVNDVLKGDDINKYEDYNSNSVSHISFSAGGTGRGDFYLDNIFTPATERYILDVNTVGGGTVLVNPGEAKYFSGTVVELNATAYPGWSFDHWEKNLTGTTNPAYITMEDDKSVTAVFITGNVIPTVQTKNTSDITNTSATLYGNLIDNGGENCSVWFEWDEITELVECMGTIVTGSVCKDNRSILHKARHYKKDNQRPRFFQGTNYSYFGVGNDNTPNMCRMGQNEKGLAMANADVFGSHLINNSILIDNTTAYTTDRSSLEDNDFHHCLGNYDTVHEAATWLATHSNYHGNYWIISSEPGVGAIVCIDKSGNSTITWINNSYAAVANVFYCNGGHDSDWGPNDVTAEKIMRDIVENSTSSDGDNLINWQDIAQRLAKDTRNKEEGNGTFYVGSYGGEISNGATRASIVCVAGNSSFNNSLHMSWLAFGKTTQISIFLPLYAGNLSSADNIPVEFGDDSGTNPGIQPYVDVKEVYANEGLSSNWYHCDRVREIQKYAFYNENITFDEFDNIMETSMPNENEVKSSLSAFVNETLPIALDGYINNVSTSASLTGKQYPQEIGTFNETITGLKPGTVYYAIAYANNSVYSSSGSQEIFMIKPDIPYGVFAFTYNDSQINLTWNNGNGANCTIVERNIIPTWYIGEGTEIYNGTENNYDDTGLNTGTHYYYQFWSYASHLGLYQYSSTYDFADNTTTGVLILLVDSEFNDSVDSVDLRANDTGQDWYESRDDDPTLLTLNTFDVGGNSGKKAKFDESETGSSYLTQEFGTPQSDVLSVQWDIYVDSILDISSPDRAGWMLIGDDSDSTRPGPNSDDPERFVYMTFFKNGGGTTGTMDLVARDVDDGWTAFTTVATDLNLKQWHTIKVICNLTSDTYDVYVDDVFESTITARHAKTSLKHISFCQWNDGAGTFFVDNVFAPAVERYKLDISVVGNGNVGADPGESTYANGTNVDLTATADIGWSFDSWSGDVPGGHESDNPLTITIDGDKSVSVLFTQNEYTLTTHMNGSGSGTLEVSPSGPYHYDDVVTLWANASVGSVFSGWYEDLSGMTNSGTLTIVGNMDVTAEFTLSDYTLTTSMNGSGSGTLEVSPTGPYHYDDVVTLWANASVGSVFSGWYEDLSGMTNPGTLTIVGNMDVTAEFTFSTVDIPLDTGWNLITVPVENSYTAMTLSENITNSVMVSRFDAENQTYKTYIVDGPPSFDFPIVDGYGYFVLVSDNSYLNVSSSPISSVSVDLELDWNMIGWYHTYNTTASSLGENITGCIMVSWFDSISHTFKTYIVGGPPSFDFTVDQGMGLFVLVDTASIWYGEG